MRADADLPWYYTQAAGDAGLRSPLGSQLELMQAQQLVDGRTVDAGQIEEAALDRVGIGRRIRRIEATLGRLEPHQVAVLRLHYTGGSLPFAVDPAAALLPLCQRWTALGGPYPQDLRGALHGATEAQRKAIAVDADRAVTQAMEAYEETSHE